MNAASFRALVDHASDVIYRLDASGRITYVNAALASTLGYEPSEVIGQRADAFVAPGSASRTRSHYARQFRQSIEHTFLEVPVVAKDGRVIWFGQHAHRVSTSGRFAGFEVVARDVSEHRRLADLQTGQKCLLEIIARGKPLVDVLDTLAFFLEAQIDNTAVAVLVLDANGRLIRPLVAPGLGDESVQAIESVWESDVPIAEHLDVIPKERVKVIDLSADAVWQERSAGSDLHFAAAWTVPVLSMDRSAAGVLVFFRHEVSEPLEHEHRLLDIAAQIAGIAIERERMERTVRIELKRRVAERTLELELSNRKLRLEIEERRKAERKLLRSEGLLKEAERIAHIGSWSWFPGESRQLWSDETYRIFGVTVDTFEPRLRSIVRMIHADDRRRIRDLIMDTSGLERRVAELRIIRPDGEERIVEMQANAKGQNGDARLIGVVHDITEQRQLERELLKAGENERKRVGRDLHDGLGQLLTGIGFLSKTLAQTLQARKDETASEAAEITHLVEDAIDHTRSLSKLLLPVELEVNGLEAALQRLRWHVTNVYGIACKLKTGAYLPIQDPEIALHMYRVAQEAVHNAVRHGKPSRVEVTLSTKSGKTRLSVADNGIGLPEGVEQRGGGLGLRTMQYRAQTIGATLSITPRKGGGTQVCCELPTPAEEKLEVTPKLLDGCT